MQIGEEIQISKSSYKYLEQLAIQDVSNINKKTFYLCVWNKGSKYSYMLAYGTLMLSYIDEIDFVVKVL
jgi:hypothetical protein